MPKVPMRGIESVDMKKRCDYVPKLTAPTCVARSPMLIDETTLTMNSMMNRQLSIPGGLESLMLPE